MLTKVYNGANVWRLNTAIKQPWIFAHEESYRVIRVHEITEYCFFYLYLYCFRLMACLFLVNVLSLSIFHENSLKEQFIFKTIKNKVVAEAEKTRQKIAVCG